MLRENILSGQTQYSHYLLSEQFFSFAYCIYKKSYSALIFIPIGLLAVVPLLSPVNGMERYMLPAIYTLPLLLAVIVNVNKESKKNEESI
ncbi:MAG: DUF6020 family protein [Leuconostoc mesenteroides]